MNAGSFGFKIGKKMRLMKIENHMDIAWQVGVREMYVLLKHYSDPHSLMERMNALKDAKGTVHKKALEKCKYFTDIDTPPTEQTWETATKYCQGSFIHLLECGYFLNNGTKNGTLLLLDFNKQSMFLYHTDSAGKQHEHQQATFEEILAFEHMPTLSLEELLSAMRERYHAYESNLHKIQTELDRIETVIAKTKEMGADQNILMKTQHLKDTLQWDLRRVKLEYRFFYHQLDALQLIEHDHDPPTQLL